MTSPGPAQAPDRQRPTVTVVVPAYNAERTIGGTLTSILTQDYPGLDVVVVDDGSQDATAALVEAYAASGQPVRLVRQENQGVSAARNAGIRAASGELVAVLDSDDQMLPGYLDTAVSAWQDGGPRSWVALNGYLLTDGGFDPRRKVMHLPKPADDAQVRAILEGNFTSMFVLFPSELLAELGGYDEGLAACEDWDLAARAILSGWRVRVVREPMALYRWTPGSLSSAAERMASTEEAMLVSLRERFADRIAADDLAYLDERIAAGSIMRIGRRGEDALRAGDFDTARETYRLAARLTPSDRRSVVKAKTLGTRLGATFWRRRLLAADRATGRDAESR